MVTPDNGEQYVVELSNATLTNIEGQRAKDATLTITIDRADLESVMMGKTTFDEQISAGNAKLEGDRRAYEVLKASLAQSDMGVEILPGTKARPEMSKMSPFEQMAPARSDGG